MDFDKAFEKVIGHEGGYVNDPNDPGGETKYGISKRAYPYVDIAGLTLEEAKRIYRRDYWDKVKGDALPFLASWSLFDAAVNHGVTQAVTMAQRAVSVAPDGILGPITLAAIRMQEPASFAAKLSAQRLHLYTSLSGWIHFGRGWTRRIAKNLEDL